MIGIKLTEKHASFGETFVKIGLEDETGQHSKEMGFETQPSFRKLLSFNS